MLGFTFAVCVVAWVEYELIFKPIMAQLVEEENGTMTLLKMIPLKVCAVTACALETAACAQVRELVPKIAMYLEKGVIHDDEEDAACYPPCPHVERFIQAFSKGTMDQSDCFKILDKSKYVRTRGKQIYTSFSPHSSCRSSVVIANDQGFMLFVNRAGLAMIGVARSEVDGTPLKSIVPDAMAASHHLYIEKYLATGVARLIGKGRDLLVKARSGALIHCYAFLSEVRKEKSLIFVAQLDPYVAPEAAS